MQSTLEISGIKCDGCDYRNPDVLFDDYDNWLNKPCPKCGKNLLTEADYKTVKVLYSMVELGDDNDDVNSMHEPIIIATLDMNGSGELTIVNMEIKKRKKKMKTLTIGDLVRATNEDKGMVMVGRIIEIDEFLVYFTTVDGEDLMIDQDQVTHKFGDVEDTEDFLDTNNDT